MSIGVAIAKDPGRSIVMKTIVWGIYKVMLVQRSIPKFQYNKGPSLSPL